MLFVAYIGSWPYSLVNAAIKKVNKVIECDIEEADPYSGIGGNDDRSRRMCDNNSEDDSEDDNEDDSQDDNEDNSEDNKDGVSSADIGLKELELILY